MKSLGIIVCLMLMTVSLPGTSAPASMPQFVRDAADMNEAITGHHIDLSNAELVASQEFTLPPGALGVQASYDAVSDVLTVVPVTAMPDTSGESGCILLNDFTGFGYTKSGTPPPIGNYQSGCTYGGEQEHPGLVDSATLVCINEAYCVVLGYAFQVVPPFNFSYRYLQLYCQFNTVTVAQGTYGQPVSSLGNGLCQAFSFEFGAAPAGHYGYVNGQPGATTAGLINS